MYYPKSQIKTGLYTNGGEYAYASNKAEYVGPYWKTSSGKYFTGLSPQDKPSNELVIITSLSEEQSLSEDKQSISVLGLDNFAEFENQGYSVDYASVIGYDEAKGNNILNPKPKSIPLYSYPKPTEKDYNAGVLTRYLCKKINQNIYIEINKETYDKLVSKDASYSYTLYFPFNLTWTLVGESPEKVANINKNIVALTERRLKITGLAEYFKNYSQFFQVG
jgi:hypothetical protein